MMGEAYTPEQRRTPTSRGVRVVTREMSWENCVLCCSFRGFPVGNVRSRWGGIQVGPRRLTCPIMAGVCIGAPCPSDQDAACADVRLGLPRAHVLVPPDQVGGIQPLLRGRFPRAP